MRLIDRYILSELVGPAGFGLMIFSSLWLVNVLMKVIDMMVTKEVALVAVAKYILYTVRVVLTTRIAMARLVAPIMPVCSITSQSELTGMHAGGLTLYRVLEAIWAVGLLASVFVFWLNEYVVPV